MSARSEIFTTKGVKTLKPFFSNYYILHFRLSNTCISSNNVTISKIEVSLFPSESALSKYAIKHTTIIFRSTSFWNGGSHIFICACVHAYLCVYMSVCVCECAGMHA